jgi:hypothetical protein
LALAKKMVVEKETQHEIIDLVDEEDSTAESFH